MCYQPKGEFLLKDIKEGTYTLRTSCLNYAPVTQKVSQSQKEMVIRLKSTTFNMDQVVVTGTGTHHKLKDSPVPVEVISQRDLQNANPSSFQDALGETGSLYLGANHRYGNNPIRKRTA